MPIDSKQKREFKAKAHHLKPVILVGGKGVTDAVIAETDNALNHHELMKVKIASTERDERQAMIEALVNATEAELIGVMGKIAILYREKQDD